MTQANLWRNENHHGPAPACHEALAALPADQLFEYATDSPLVDRLAALLDVDATSIALGQGAEDILTQALQHLIRPGERVLVPSASWWYYPVLVNRVSGQAVHYPVTEDGDDYRVDVDALLHKHAAHPARVILIATVSNPTGNAFPLERLPEVCEQARDAIVIADDAYFGFGTDTDPAWLAQLTRRYPNLLIARTFSKLHALAGARIGYAVAGAGLTGFLAALARSLGHNRVSEALGVAALNSPDYYARIAATIAADRDRLVKALADYPEVTVYRSAANFQLVRFPHDVVPFARHALDVAGLAVKWMNEPQFRDCARISVGTTAEHARVITHLTRVLERRLRGRYDSSSTVNARCDLTLAYQMAAAAEAGT